MIERKGNQGNYRKKTTYKANQLKKQQNRNTLQGTYLGLIELNTTKVKQGKKKGVYFNYKKKGYFIKNY